MSSFGSSATLYHGRQSAFFDVLRYTPLDGMKIVAAAALAAIMRREAIYTGLRLRSYAYSAEINS